MLGYTTRRLLVVAPTVLGVVTVVFLLLHAMPGDPVDAMLGESATVADRAELRRHLGLDRPLLTQYAEFLGGLAKGDLGTSIHGGRSVSALIAAQYPATLGLALAAVAVALAIALPLGLLAAARPYGPVDRASLAAGLLGAAVPNFWLGPMLIIVFAVKLGWLPVSGIGGPAHYVLPAVTLGGSMAGILTRMTRTTVLETLHEEYVRTARAKGASELVVLGKHALANAATPILSIVGLQFGALLAGATITENVFARPGLGTLIFEAIKQRNYPVVQGCVLVVAVITVTVNLLVDLAYGLADPRIRRA